MKMDLEKKFYQIKLNYFGAINTATCFGWLALVAVIFLFFAATCSDLLKFVSYLKKIFPFTNKIFI
jgi:hypothetical protein